MSTMTHYRIGDLGSEARAVVETLVGRGLGDEDRLGLVVIGDAPVPVSEPAEAEEGERRRQAWLRLSAELDALPLIHQDDVLSAADVDRVIYGGPA